MDWSAYDLDVLTKLNLPGEVDGRTKNLGEMDFAGDTNVPDNFVRLNRDMRQLEEKSGSDWLPALRPLMLAADRDTTSDTDVAVSDFDGVYALESGKIYRYTAVIRYVAGDSGVVFGFPNLNASGIVPAGLARFVNLSGTNLDVSGGASSPEWVCPAADISTGGTMFLEGVIQAASSIALEVAFRRETASGTLSLRAGSWLRFERLA